MQRRFLSLAIIVFILFSVVNWSCSKFDTTTIGANLLPVVDNVSVFADTLQVITTQGVYNPDTNAISRTENYAFGINNDPLFGTTNASIYFQFKPTFFPYYLGGYNDTLNGYGAGLDSVVLSLKYLGFYGDSSIPLQIQVREVVDAGFRDSMYTTRNVNYHPVLGQVLGTGYVSPATMATVWHYSTGTDSVSNRIRILLSPSTWATNLYNSDTLALSANLHAFYSDSLYRHYFNGLAVVATGVGNQLIYTNLSDSSQLEIHFRRRNAGKIDTIYNALKLNADPYGSTTNFSSSVANYIQRNRPALPNGSQEIYLQTNPGTYANLSIPGLSALSNKIVHRAELVIQQIPEIPVSVFRAPAYLYLDLQDSINPNLWKPIYFDLNPNTTYDPDYSNPLLYSFYPGASVGVDHQYFGDYRRDGFDKNGNAMSYYTMNITKYVQQIATNHRFNYKLRLRAPSKFIYPQYAPTYLTYPNSIAWGRVKVGGGNNANYRMMLRIIYSNL